MPRTAAILLGGFVAFSIAVAAGWLVPLDAATTNAMAAIRSPFLTEVAANFTALGSEPVVTVFAVLAAVYCVLAGRPRLVLALLWTPLAFLLGSVVKLLVHRPRPIDALIIVPTTFAYPSGHAAAASALFLTLALLAAGGERRAGPRRLLIGAGLALALLVAWSRVYLGVHYFSDVIGGLLLGTAGAIVAQTVTRRPGRRSDVQALSGR